MRARRVWMSIRWPLVAALFAGGLVLGTWGFDRYMELTGQPSSTLDDFMLSLQLIVLQSGAVPPPIPWQLEVARFLVPLVAAYATLSAVAVVFSAQVTEFRARRSSDHVVVCGLGRLGAPLAKAFRRAGHRVVAVESEAGNGSIRECRAEGIIVLAGDARDRVVLDGARVGRARYLFAVTGDDGVNAEIAIEARGLVAGRRGPPLTCFVHLLDERVKRFLKQRGMAGPADGSLRVEYFNAAERGAPALLRDHAPFDDSGTTPLGHPHLVVVGLGEMGSSLVVQSARRWHNLPATEGRRFRVTAVDRRAGERVTGLRQRFPRLEDACELVPCSMDLDSAEFERAEFLSPADGSSPVTSVYVCIGDDADGLGAALHLRGKLPSAVPVVARTTQEGGVGTLVDDGPDSSGGLEVFGLMDLVCRPEVLLAGEREVLARAVHENYVRAERAAGRTPDTNPSMVHWEELPEALRESNRGQAADIGHKCAAVECDLEPLTDWDAEPLELTHEEVERLARLEHARWCAEKVDDGWSTGERDDGRKRHPDLVPYDDLSEAAKDKDRRASRDIPGFLARVGYAVVRRRLPPVGIGVTGHRVLTDTDRLRSGLDEVAHRLEHEFPGGWTVVSALAEGADRLVAHRLLAREGTRLVAVLPLERDDYAADFATEASRQDFADLLSRADEVVRVPPQLSREAAYEAGGDAVLARVDALVAVWDGQVAQGPGGTGGVVAEARARGLPLAWVRAGNRTPGTVERTSLGAAQGLASFERFGGTRGKVVR